MFLKEFFEKDNLEIYRPLITFANSLDPDQDGQNIATDLDPNKCLFLYRCTLVDYITIWTRIRLFESMLKVSWLSFLLEDAINITMLV